MRPTLLITCARLVLGRAALATVALALLLPPAPAVASSVLEQESSRIATSEETGKVGFRAGSFVFAPIPFKSPLVGNGLALGGGYLFQNDLLSHTSNIVLGGFKTDNGSNGFGILTNLAFSRNRWQATAFLARANLTYDLYTAVGPLEIRQQGDFFDLKLGYGFTPQISLGPTFRYLESTIGVAVAPADLLPDLDLKVAAVGLAFNWDRRDNSDYPTRGGQLDVEAFAGGTLEGLKRRYGKGYANYDHFFSLGTTTVLATRLSVCAASSNAPFFDKCSVGMNDNFRGYPATQFLSPRSASAQIELRQRLGKRFGVVVFGGLGGSGPAFDRLDANGTLAAAGIGGRFRLSRKFPVDFSVDVSWNDDDDQLVYVYVGQRW